MSHFTAHFWEDFHALCSDDPAQALASLREWEQQGVDDENFVINKPGILIDVGSALRDAAVIQEGVDLLEAELVESERRGLRFSASQWFNLGNGHYAAENARRGRDNYVYAPTDTPMTRAKECYRNALAELARPRAQKNATAGREALEIEEEEGTSRLQTELLINYGNSLNELGRVLEAFDFYEEALVSDPQHPMAWGRLGETLFNFAQFAHDPQLVRKSVTALQESACGDRLERYGYGYVRPTIERHLERALKQWDSMAVASSQHKKPSISTPYHERFVQFCTHNRLFLNFSLRRALSPHPYEDKFRFSIVTPINDQEKFPRLARTLNELVERFASARLLLFEAHEMPYDATFYDTITRYIDLNDASVYGIRAAKLKLAYESAYNVLDKLALFLNSYLELGLDPKQVNFATVWSQKSGSSNAMLRQTLLDKQNDFIFALYDLACDFGKNAQGEEGDWSNYKTTRHLLTHRYLVLHAIDWDWQIVDGPQYHRAWEDMTRETASLLYLTRNALLYLFLAIQLEEGRTKVRHGKEQRVMTRPFPLHPPDSGLI